MPSIAKRFLSFPPVVCPRQEEKESVSRECSRSSSSRNQTTCARSVRENKRRAGKPRTCCFRSQPLSPLVVCLVVERQQRSGQSIESGYSCHGKSANDPFVNGDVVKMRLGQKRSRFSPSGTTNWILQRRAETNWILQLRTETSIVVLERKGLESSRIHPFIKSFIANGSTTFFPSCIIDNLQKIDPNEIRDDK